MARASATHEIFLGEGVFYIGETPIGLTRGGGQFTVEREVSDSDSKKVVTGTGKIVDSDYQDFVKFVGMTDKGKEVVIKVENAINLENIDWTLTDKDEVVPALTYTGCYKEDSPAEYEPWSVTYATA